ncbi:hypothetical protein ANO11243_070620 [Dothideomycetidae sp. 11243]|nr:hypothetical protein ANO11243_070620 [fungal sp. No.11243]
MRPHPSRHHCPLCNYLLKLLRHKQSVALNPQGKAKGWRSTPLLEEASGPGQTVDTPPAKPSTLMVKPSTRAKKSGRRSRQEQQAQQNGWATEDATDVQDMGDFDFEANLSKFDKKAVFETIRNDDMTADEDRLVSHNRIARPGTYGGKNLHPTEMVLSPPIKPVGDSELDVLSYSASDVDLANDRDSRQSLQARNHVMGAPERAISGIGERSLSRTLRNVSSNQRPLNASVLSAASLNRSTSSIRNSQTHSDRGGPHLKVLSTGTPCPIVSRERLQHLVKEYGDIPGLCNGGLIEVTALAIAQAVCKATYHLHDPSRRNSRASPVIVILAGNHDRGSYVLAAARYLLGKDFRLLVSYADSDKADASDALCSRQLALLRRLPRRRNLWIDSWPLINAQIKKLKSPPALILDALLDGSSYGAIENIQSAIETREVIDWCNRSRAQVISIACPSGYDDRTGETTVLEGEPVAVKPDRVLALGAALQGVFLAMSEGERWGLTVLDVGLSMVLHGKEVIRYGMDWSMDVEFDGGD